MMPVRETIYAVSRNMSRYYLNGVHLHCHEGLMYATASDAHRLSVRAV